MIKVGFSSVVKAWPRIVQSHPIHGLILLINSDGSGAVIKEPSEKEFQDIYPLGFYCPKWDMTSDILYHSITLQNQ
jgi:hypothetical protein